MPLSHKLAVKIAAKYGFFSTYQRGSHEHFAFNNHKVTIPKKKEFSIGTAKSILEQIAKTHGQGRRDLVQEFQLKL